MDFRQYDAALGRFNNMDALSELAYSQTPYRYGFNNPVHWTDPTGLFESPEAAEFFAMNDLGLGKGQFSIKADGFGSYILTVQGGEFNGQEFYNSTLLHEIEELVIQANGNSNGGGTRSSSDSEIDWAQVNQGVNAFGFANGTKTLLIDMAGETSSLTKATANYLKVFKGVGAVGGVATIAITGYDIYEKGYATGRDIADIGFATAGVVGIFIVSNPVGWIIGGASLAWAAGTLIYDYYND